MSHFPGKEKHRYRDINSYYVRIVFAGNLSSYLPTKKHNIFQWFTHKTSIIQLQVKFLYVLPRR